MTPKLHKFWPSEGVQILLYLVTLNTTSKYISTEKYLLLLITEIGTPRQVTKTRKQCLKYLRKQRRIIGNNLTEIAQCIKHVNPLAVPLASGFHNRGRRPKAPVIAWRPLPRAPLLPRCLAFARQCSPVYSKGTCSEVSPTQPCTPEAPDWRGSSLLALWLSQYGY